MLIVILRKCLFKWYRFVGFIIGNRILNIDHNKPIILHIALIKMGGLSKYVNDLASDSVYDSYVLRGGGIITYKGLTFALDKNNIDIINQINPDIIHVHQMDGDFKFFNWVTDCYKTVFTIHDCYFVCHKYFMVRNGINCHPTQCNLAWKQSMFELYKKANKIICPSQSMRNLFCYYFPSLNDKIEVIEHA